MITNPLMEPLSPEQARLLQVIYAPFDISGEWPFWQFVDLTLDSRYGLDGRSALASLPLLRHPSPAMWSSTYGLTWYQHNGGGQPSPETPVALTVAALRHLPDATPLLGAFLATLQYLVDQQSKLIPSPRAVVEATVTSEAIAGQVLTASIGGSSGPPVDVLMRKLREVFNHEPLLYSAVQHPYQDKEEWTIRVPAALRVYRGLESIDDYLSRLTQVVAPPAPPSVPISSNALDIPYAAGYLDAVWKSANGAHLFVNIDPASAARLTQPCDSEEEFNSLMSALADLLGQTVVPGQSTPRQRGALEAVRDSLLPKLDTAAAERASNAFATLIRLRQIRVSTQHSDARHRAIAAFEEIGLPFPPVNWAHAWAHVSVLAKGALDVLREEVHVAVSR